MRLGFRVSERSLFLGFSPTLTSSLSVIDPSSSKELALLSMLSIREVVPLGGRRGLSYKVLNVCVPNWIDWSLATMYE